MAHFNMVDRDNFPCPKKRIFFFLSRMVGTDSIFESGMGWCSHCRTALAQAGHFLHQTTIVRRNNVHSRRNFRVSSTACSNPRRDWATRIISCRGLNRPWFSLVFYLHNCGPESGVSDQSLIRQSGLQCVINEGAY